MPLRPLLYTLVTPVTLKIGQGHIVLNSSKAP